MKNIILCLSIVSILGACSSLKIDDTKAADKCFKKGTWQEIDPCLKLVKKTAGGIPHWMKKVPQKENAYYSTGTAISADLQLSIDKSTLNAKRTLADRINGEMSAQIKTFMIESGQGNGILSNDVEQVTKNRTYVLIEYPVGQANDILVEQVRRNNLLYSKIRVSKSFKELEESVDEKVKSDEKRIEAITNSVEG